MTLGRNFTLMCCDCKNIDTMTIPYGKTMKCMFHTKGECSDTMRKMKCNICGCKYGDKVMDEDSSP